jgi:hypothetical protein
LAVALKNQETKPRRFAGLTFILRRKSFAGLEGSLWKGR